MRHVTQYRRDRTSYLFHNHNIHIKTSLNYTSIQSYDIMKIKLSCTIKFRTDEEICWQPQCDVEGKAEQRACNGDEVGRGNETKGPCCEFGEFVFVLALRAVRRGGKSCGSSATLRKTREKNERICQELRQLWESHAPPRAPPTSRH